MGCGKIGRPCIKSNNLLLLKERLCSSDQVRNPGEFGCNKAQALPKVQLARFSFRPMTMEKIPLSEPDIETFVKSIEKTFIELKSSIDIFHEASHSQCIKNFRLVDGIMILLISASASINGELSMANLEGSPYFKLKNLPATEETELLHNAWLGLVKNMKNLMESHMGIAYRIKEITFISTELERTFTAIDSYGCSNNPNIEGNKKFVAQAVIMADEILEKAKNFKQALNEFFKTIKQEMSEINRYGKIAAERKAFSAEKINHVVLRCEANNC